MKKLVALALFALAATVCLPAQQPSDASQTVADAARKQQAKENAAPTRKVWTNDDFPDRPAPAEATADQTAAKDDKGVKDDKDKAKENPVEDQAKLDAEWKGKIDSQKARIADLQREYDLTDREFKLATTTYYADAGNRLRDQKDFEDKQQQYRDKINSLKQQIADEQTKLSDLQDEAHKAGANKAYE